MKSNRKKDWIHRATAIALSACIIAVTFFICPARPVFAAAPTFSNAVTVESDVRTLLQSAINNMASPTPYSNLDPSINYAQWGIDASYQASIIFKTDGVETAKKFLVTDSSGNIKIPIEIKSYLKDGKETDIFLELLDLQMMSMNVSNHNAYTRLALESMGYNFAASYSMSGGVIIGIQLLVGYVLNWRDGTSALAARNAVTTHANNYLTSSSYTSLTTDYARMKAINNYICSTFQYDYRVLADPNDPNVIYSAYQMITDTGGEGYPRGVCQAYAMYGYIMLKAAGFEAITIDGTAGAGLHAWNMVKIDGYWYHIDFTWDDPVSGGNPPPYDYRQSGAGIVSENFLLRSDAEMKKDDNHLWASIQDGYTYPVASYKWTDTPPIINVTQPPAPTAVPTVIPTQVVKPVVTVTPAASFAASSGLSDPTTQNASLSAVVSNTSEKPGDQPVLSGSGSESNGLFRIFRIGRTQWIIIGSTVALILLILLIAYDRKNRYYR